MSDNMAHILLHSPERLPMRTFPSAHRICSATLICTPLLLLGLLLVLLLVAGCSEETITEPVPGPPGSFPGTADQLMVNFQDAYATMNYDAYQGLIHPDYRFLFTDTDINGTTPLPTDHMVSLEELGAHENMFSGEVVFHPDGTIASAVSDISVDLFEPVDEEWGASDQGSAFPGTQRRRYQVRILIARPGNATMLIEGQQEFFVTSGDSVQSDGSSRAYFQLAGQRDLIDTQQSMEKDVEKVEDGTSWGMAKLPYYSNHAPVAVMSYQPVAGEVDPVFRFDATDSFDPDSGLHAQPYRWRFGTRGDFTPWSSEPTIVHGFEEPGEKTIQLQVRDRWNRLAMTQELINVTTVFPDTEDQLMANFLWSLGNLNLAAYTPVLHADFLFRFQNFDVERFNLPSQYLNRAEELQVAANTFATASGISEIVIQMFEPLEGWVDSVNPLFPDSRRRIYEIHLQVIRPGDTTFVIGGLQEFFVAGRDSTVPGGEMRTYFELKGQLDWSNAKASEGVSWGAFKVLFMPGSP